MAIKRCTHCGNATDKHDEDSYKQYGLCVKCYDIPDVLESRRYQNKEGKRADPHKIMSLLEKANSSRKSK